MNGLWQDTRYALRTMRRAPLFTTVAVLSLALGIGANTAIFSFIDTLMLRSLPVREPGRLVELLSRYPGDPDNNDAFSLSVYQRFRDQNHVFSDLVAVSLARFQATGERLAAEPVDGAYVVGTLFSALGVRPAIGRLIDPDDDKAGAAPAAVISWSLWRRAFSLDPAVLGTRLVLDATPVTVVGVAPREFTSLQTGMRTD